MASYKQIVLDIKDYISLETATINRILENKEHPTRPDIRATLIAERDALKDVLDIIVRDGGK